MIVFAFFQRLISSTTTTRICPSCTLVNMLLISFLNMTSVKVEFLPFHHPQLHLKLMMFSYFHTCLPSITNYTILINPFSRNNNIRILNMCSINIKSIKNSSFVKNKTLIHNHSSYSNIVIIPAIIQSSSYFLNIR